MEYINITPQNIDREHICCAISGGEAQTKKDWMKGCYPDGLTFYRAKERGKVFVEYLPAEKGWRPIIAPNHLLIHCFWVSGKFQGQGRGKQLLTHCVKDAKEQGKDGVVVITGDKNRAFLPDPKFFARQGFELADKAPPFFWLMHLPLGQGAAAPKFTQATQSGRIDRQGFVLYYTHQCPFAEKYGKQLAAIAKERGKEFAMVRLESYRQAQAAPTPFPSYTLYYNGAFVTNEILSQSKFCKMFAQELG